MTQFVNNDLMIDFIYFIALIIENYLFLTMLLLFFDVHVTKTQKLIYMILVIPLGKITAFILPMPFNIIINYTCTTIIINLIFKLNILKSFTSLLINSFVFGLLNTLLQNPYMSLLHIESDAFLNNPAYRIPYLTILYLILLVIIIILTKIRNKKINLDFLDTLDKKTIILLTLNLIIGFLTLCTQLIITAYYIDIVPIIITILNFILLVSFLLLSIYSFTRMIKLTNTRKTLECAEEYNKSLEILYDKVKGYKHDFDNIISTLDGFIENEDMPGLKKYFNDVKKDCKITNNIALINPRIINNAGIYSLLNNKYFKAINLGITFEFEFFLNVDNLEVNMYKFSRALGILLDNAIEEAEKCPEKIVKASFIRENRNSRSVITIKNTYLNKDVNIEKIFKKGESGKENHFGIGLWEIQNYVKKSKNLDLYTSKTPDFFIQELSIYDLK